MNDNTRVHHLPHDRTGDGKDRPTVNGACPGAFSAARDRIELLPEGQVRARAPAKINLNLLVGPRRADGCHGLDSIVAKVTLYDVIDLRPRDDGEISFSCAGADCGPDDDNLVPRAANLLATRRRAAAQGADIALVKGIPAGTGLGGGSSDAAAVLLALNDLWRLGLDRAGLAEIAAGLGADVPLFLGGPAARISGRGEHVAAIEVHPFTAVLFLPDFTCSTAAVYRAFDKDPPPPAGPPDPALIAARPPSQWRGLLVNQLAPAARRVCPALGRLWDELSEALPLPVHLTGSGSGLFVLCDGDRELRTVLSAVPAQLSAICRQVRPNPW